MSERGARVAQLRIGLVLSMRGGALPKIVGPIRYGIGGPLGDGSQIQSWIELNDLLGAVKFALENESLEGPINCVAPQTVSNGELTRHIGRMLRRPSFLGVPVPLLRLLAGREMADELLLASARVEPTRLMKAGFRWRFPRIEDALQHLLEAAGLIGDKKPGKEKKAPRGSRS